VSAFATESGHWYSKNGDPCYTIKGANGQERPTTLRDARKLGLLPSVTEIIKSAAKPALERWKERQVMLAALTLPRLPGEPDDSFCDRVIADSREQARKAAERGTALHAAIELHFRGQPYAADWMPHCEAVEVALSGAGINPREGLHEHSFASPMGYGGKVDLHAPGWILDWKSKDEIKDDTKAWDEQGMQLVAYDHGLGNHGRRLANVFIGVSDRKVKLHIWKPEESAKHWQMFTSLLAYWKASKGYDPSATDKAA
jgi:hypothetical protein